MTSSTVTRDATHDHGVDVILDMVGGDYIERNFRAAAKLGRIVNIAFPKGIKVEVNFGPMMMKRLSFMATTLRGRTNAEKGAIRDAVVREVWPLIATGPDQARHRQHLPPRRGPGRPCPHGRQQPYREDFADGLKETLSLSRLPL